MAEETDPRWRKLNEEVLSGMKEWRQAHPKATLREIEEAVTARMSRLTARLIQDLALSSPASDWRSQALAERPPCPQCATPPASAGEPPPSSAKHGRARHRTEPDLWDLSHLWGRTFSPR